MHHGLTTRYSDLNFAHPPSCFLVAHSPLTYTFKPLPPVATTARLAGRSKQRRIVVYALTKLPTTSAFKTRLHIIPRPASSRASSLRQAVPATAILGLHNTGAGAVAGQKTKTQRRQATVGKLN